MPGIFGAIELSALPSRRQEEDLVAVVQRMSRVMRYEPGYSSTIVLCSGAGACVGRTGLYEDVVPDPSRSGALVVGVSTGEPGFGSRTAPGIPASCAGEVLRAYARAGDFGITSLPGVRAGFLCDKASRRCVLFNDRYGRERIFIHVGRDRLLFASEAKAILAVAPETRRFDPTGLAQWLACGSTLGQRSLFAGIDVLEGGTILTCEKGVASRRRYFEPSILEALEPASGDEFLAGFSESLRAAVGACVEASPKVGISLTGGMDSRMIMASFDAPAGAVPCYTFGSMYRTTADVAVGRSVAASCGQPHHVIELGPAFVQEASDYLERSAFISDGYLGLSGAAELYVNRQARAIAPARMTGNWGGELMRGVRAFKYGPPKGNFITPDLSQRVKESALEFSTVSSHPLSAALFQQVPFQGYGRYSIERSQVTVRTPFLADDVISWLYRAPAAVRESRAAAALIGTRPELLRIPTDLGFLGTGLSLPRRAMRRALIKSEYLTSHGAPDWVTKLSAVFPAPLLESRFLGVDKFQHFRFWMRHALSSYVRDTLIHSDNSRLQQWFDMSRVADMVEAHISGRANYTDTIDKLLTVASVGRTLLTSAVEAADRTQTEAESGAWAELKA